jgi:hypothetical protein
VTIGARKNFFFCAADFRASWIMKESVFRGRWLPCSSIVPKGKTIVFVSLRYLLNSCMVMRSNMYMVFLLFYFPPFYKDMKLN